MARGSTLTVSLTGTLDRYVRDKLASWNYESASDVIVESLRLSKSLEQQRHQFWAETNRKKVAVARRQIANGETFDGETTMNELIEEASKPLPTKRKKKRVK